MKWFRVDVAFALSPEFLEHPAELRAALYSLHALAAQHEAGGLIPNCKAWSRRQWDRAAAVTPALVTRLVDVGLTRWSGPDGADLEILSYDHEGEAKAKARVDSARNAAIEKHRRAATAEGSQVRPESDGSARNVTVRDVTRRDGTTEGAGAPAQPPLAGLDVVANSLQSNAASGPAGAARRVTDHFTARYTERTGAAPTWKRDRHFANLKSLLEQHRGDADLLIARIDVLFDAPPDFLARSTPDFDTFVQHFDKLAAPARTAGANGRLGAAGLAAIAAQGRREGTT